MFQTALRLARRLLREKQDEVAGTTIKHGLTQREAMDLIDRVERGEDLKTALMKVKPKFGCLKCGKLKPHLISQLELLGRTPSEIRSLSLNRQIVH